MGTFRKLKRSIQKNFENIKESEAIHKDSFEDDELLIFNSNGTHVKCIYKYYSNDRYYGRKINRLCFYLSKQEYFDLKDGKIPRTLPDKVRSRIKFIIIKDI